jgi:iron(III) transport system substrate-binding protein
MGAIFARRALRTGAVVAMVVVGGVATGGCGVSSEPKGAPTGTSGGPAFPPGLKRAEAAVQGLAPAARERKLHALGKAEGQVKVYTSLSDLVVAPLEKAWARQYPDVKLDLYRASSEDVSSKLLAERSAGRSGADIVETNGTNMLTFENKKDVLVPFAATPYRASIPAEYRYPAFTADRVEKFTVAWNTKLVPPAAVPTSFAELAAPKWKGKLAMEPTDVDWFAALYSYLQRHGGPGGTALAKDKLDALWRALAENSQFVNGHTDEANMLAAGQIQVLVGGHAQSLEQLQVKHAPVAFKPFVAPVVERPQGVGIVYGLEHPAATLLFYDWLLSPAGQRVLQSNGVEAANPRFADPHFATNPPTIHVALAPIVARYAAWQTRYESFTHTSGKG